MNRALIGLTPAFAMTSSVLAQSLFLTNTGQMQATADIPGITSTSAFLPVVQPGPGSNTASLGLVSSSMAYEFIEATNSELSAIWNS